MVCKSITIKQLLMQLGSNFIENKRILATIIDAIKMQYLMQLWLRK